MTRPGLDQMAADVARTMSWVQFALEAVAVWCAISVPVYLVTTAWVEAATHAGVGLVTACGAFDLNRRLKKYGHARP